MKLTNILLSTALLSAASCAFAHPVMGAIPRNRQVSRIVYAHCVSCHREGGTSLSLLELRSLLRRSGGGESGRYCTDTHLAQLEGGQLTCVGEAT